MSEPSEQRPMTSKPQRRRRLPLVLGVVGVAAVLGIGAVVGIRLATAETSTTEETRTFELQAPRLSVDLAAGDLVLTGTSGDRVEVRRTVHSRGWGEPEIEEASTPAGVAIQAGCPGWFSWGCEVDYEIGVPDGLTLQLESSSGAVRIGEVAAASTTVDVSSGDIEVTGATGPLTVESSSGEITAQDLNSPVVSAVVSSGEITLDFAEPPRTVTVDASSGDVDLTLPTDDGPYRLDVSTSSGEQQLAVPHDPASPRAITVEASSGDVTLHSD